MNYYQSVGYNFSLRRYNKGAVPWRVRGHSNAVCVANCGRGGLWQGLTRRPLTAYS
jgi:hypothetical protein